MRLAYNKLCKLCVMQLRRRINLKNTICQMSTVKIYVLKKKIRNLLTYFMNIYIHKIQMKTPRDRKTISRFPWKMTFPPSPPTPLPNIVIGRILFLINSQVLIGRHDRNVIFSTGILPAKTGLNRQIKRNTVLDLSFVFGLPYPNVSRQRTVAN